MLKVFKTIFKDANQKAIEKLLPLVKSVNELEKDFSSLDAKAIQAKSLELKARAENESLETLMPEAFALVREAAKRTLNQRHFDSQIVGGAVLSQGKIAEMKTGEGKTLAATLPAYLHGLTGKGVHIITVNDYLAQRDTVWMGQIYHFLGLKVGCLIHENSFLYDPEWKSEPQEDRQRDSLGSFKVFHDFLRPVSRREVYQAEIVYGTNHQFGFDYLRDNLVYRKDDLAQRELYFAIIDEVDSILIDEARTPLIIASPDMDAAKIYREFALAVPRLNAEKDVEIDEKKHSVFLTDSGIERIKDLFGRDIYEDNNLVLVHHLEESLKAYFLFKRDKNYVVKDGEVVIVDEFTGRLMHGRRYSGGLHQAIEAKEGLRVQEESRTSATITIQNYFRMYQILSGMTGTALTSSEEFAKVYFLDVLPIPPNKPLVRKDFSDKIFVTEKAKFDWLVKEVKDKHEKGQPVLIGTVSIEKNEHLSALLKRQGVSHNVLNAKQHEKEAEVIAQAGKKGAVTVATNMAGRGVDIILGGNPSTAEESDLIKSLGGLHVIGTERHEARRIDNQLRGRSGRQGDPGSTSFFVSLEDDLMRIFGSDKIRGLIQRLKLPEDQPIESEFVSKALDSAQQKVEGANFDTRKYILEYDDVLNKQRDAIYRKRKEILAADSGKLKEIMKKTIDEALELFISSRVRETFDKDAVWRELDSLTNLSQSLKNEFDSPESLKQSVAKFFFEKTEMKDPEFLRVGLLQIMDILWTDHLEAMEHLTDTVRLRNYAQHQPISEYKHEGHKMFKELLDNFSWNIFLSLGRLISAESNNESR
ncbi:MAG: Protein translocase subunit SecA [Parcubacteria group bacterium GW2011_GWC1_45_9]|nr:MAG: Protein translocase subunit SecA [Parcubacteria group bacterium GW2011_GWC1_45_9]HCI05230.1 preprotein translocase subunit SecA [Patescibacteria group bacterium]